MDYHTFFEAYRERLKRFNATPKYQYELRCLTALLRKGKRILDYGCGTGYAVTQLRSQGFDVYGYDRFNYVDGSPDWYRNNYNFKFDQVYFIHSFAHIPDIADVLLRLRSMVNDGGEIIILTPNRVYLDSIAHTPGYQPDTTVMHHYDLAELIEVVEAAMWKVTSKTYIGHVDMYERILIKAKI